MGYGQRDPVLSEPLDYSQWDNVNIIWAYLLYLMEQYGLFYYYICNRTLLSRTLARPYLSPNRPDQNATSDHNEFMKRDPVDPDKNLKE